MIKKILIYIGFIPLGFAVPAFKGKVDLQQDDGISFKGQMKGDEWFNWVEDDQGNVIKYNEKSKNYEYAIIKDVNGTMDLVPSNIKVENYSQEGARYSKSMGNKVDKNLLKEIWKERRLRANGVGKIH